MRSCLTFLRGTAFYIFILTLLYLNIITSLILTNHHGRHTNSKRRTGTITRNHVNSLLEPIIESVVPRRRIVPTAQTGDHKISTNNPFGTYVNSSQEAIAELVSLTTQDWKDATQYSHLRIEYLTKYLESTYIPIQTIPFLNLALEGEWNLCYSNVLTPPREDKLSINIEQQLTAEGSKGLISNNIKWSYNTDNNNAYRGIFKVSCTYSVTSKGSFDVSLKEHSIALLPAGENTQAGDVEEILSNDIEIEDLLMALQRAIPFEIFDPNEITIVHSFICPDIRIAKISGERFVNVFNIFKRVGRPFN